MIIWIFNNFSPIFASGCGQIRTSHIRQPRKMWHRLPQTAFYRGILLIYSIFICFHLSSFANVHLILLNELVRDTSLWAPFAPLYCPFVNRIVLLIYEVLVFQIVNIFKFYTLLKHRWSLLILYFIFINTHEKINFGS